MGKFIGLVISYYKNCFKRKAVHLKILQQVKMYIKSKAVALISLLLILQNCQGQRSKSPRFGSKTDVAADLHLDVSAIKCTHTAPEIIESFQCHLTRRNNSNYITITLLLHKPVERFDTNAVFDVLGPTKNYYNILRSDIDCCAFVSAKKHSIYVVDNILKLIYASINEKPTCPVKAVS